MSQNESVRSTDIHFLFLFYSTFVTIFISQGQNRNYDFYDFSVDILFWCLGNTTYFVENDPVRTSPPKHGIFDTFF